MDSSNSLFTVQQMNTVLLLLILMGLAALLLVVFYLLDRVNSLHQQAASTTHIARTDDSFGGLSGKNLWDAMIGIPMPGWDKDKLEPLRLRYEAVLQKHAELLFEDGQLDGREGFSMPVSCERTVPTLRGEIRSWIPHDYASAIYRCGHNRASLPPEEHGDIRRTLDQTGMMLFAAVGLPPHGLSLLLMPQLQPPAPPEEPQADAQAAAPEAPPGIPALGAPEQTEPNLTLTLPQGEPEAASTAMTPAPDGADVSASQIAAATAESPQTAAPPQAPPTNS